MLVTAIGILQAAFLLSLAMAEAPLADFRAPAIPLITTDPFLQNFIMGSTVTDDIVRFWDGRSRQMLGLLRVDGQTYRYLGTCPAQIVTTPGPAVKTEGQDIAPGSCDLANDHKSEADCNAWCYSTTGCRSFIMAPGGVCYLKSCVEPVVAAEGHASFVLLGNATSLPSTDVAPNTCDIDNRQLDTAACNAWCWETQACQAYVMAGSTCYLKSCSAPTVPRVDHTAFTLQPLQPLPPCPPSLTQKHVVVHPTRTIVTLELESVLELTVTFLSTLFTDDLARLSRPVSYVHIGVKSVDSLPHDVQVYLDASAEHCVDSFSEQVAWSSDPLRVGTTEQNVLGKAGDKMNINWGYLYLQHASDSTEGQMQRAGSAQAQREAFNSTGKLPSGEDTRMPRAVWDDMAALSLVKDLGSITDAHALFLYGYDDIKSVFFFKQQFKGLWTLDGDISQVMTKAGAEYTDMLQLSEQKDAALMTAMSAKAGDMYATLGALAYRQTLAATKLVWDADRNQTWNFLKEISTNGDMQTMDVIFPGSPMFLYTNPDLLIKLLVPVLMYANNETYIPFTDAYSPHQLGTYPIANDDTAHQENMPMENSGNMILMLAGIVAETQNASFFYPRFWPMLVTWADVLQSFLPFPAKQICTDDFTGPLANNSNLAVKGIVALQAFSQLCSFVNETGCDKYSSAAKDFVQVWEQYSSEATPSPHYKMSYNNPGSWSLKYNLVWQYLLDLSGPFPDDVAKTETDYYRQMGNAFGTPLDGRHAYVKTDWLSWAATLCRDDDVCFHDIHDRIYKFATETNVRVPFSDLYDTNTGDANSKTGFVDRPVIGGLFAKMLL